MKNKFGINFNLYMTSQLFFWLFSCLTISHPAICMTLSGPISANSVTVSGGVTISSVSISSLTINNLMDIQGTVNGVVLQTIYSSSTENATTTSTSPFAINGMAGSIALSNPNNYVRISINGILEASFDGVNYFPKVNLSVERDTTDIGGGALVSTINITPITVATTILDSPGDTNTHTYQVTFDVDSASSGTVANFTPSPVGYLLLEEISR
jgi:hypothetical protein